MGSFKTKDQPFYPYGMILTAVFKKFRIEISPEKQITPVDPSTWINENTLHQMRLKLVDGAWVRPSAHGPTRTEAGDPSSSGASSILELLQSLHLKQDQHLNLTQGLESKFHNLSIKIDNEFLEIHQRLNAVTSQLNQIQEQITLEE